MSHQCATSSAFAHDCLLFLIRALSGTMADVARRSTLSIHLRALIASLCLCLAGCLQAALAFPRGWLSGALRRRFLVGWMMLRFVPLLPINLRIDVVVALALLDLYRCFELIIRNIWSFLPFYHFLIVPPPSTFFLRCGVLSSFVHTTAVLIDLRPFCCSLDKA